MKNTYNTHLELVFRQLKLGKDGVWSSDLPGTEQKVEIQLREKVAAKKIENYLEIIAKHHSIPVMDNEVRRYLDSVPLNSIILDIGGCWGWHWRNIKNQRPDIHIIIVDFIRSNLHHAKILLGSLCKNIIGIISRRTN